MIFVSFLQLTVLIFCLVACSTDNCQLLCVCYAFWVVV